MPDGDDTEKYLSIDADPITTDDVTDVLNEGIPRPADVGGDRYHPKDDDPLTKIVRHGGIQKLLIYLLSKLIGIHGMFLQWSKFFEMFPDFRKNRMSRVLN